MQPSSGVSSAYEAYEAIVAALSQPDLADAVRARRAEREASSGATDGDDEGFEGRMQVFWDAAVTTPLLLERIRDRVSEGILAWIGPFGRAHRGLFAVDRDDSGAPLMAGSAPIIRDVWSGAAFILTPLPPRELALALRTTEGRFDGRVVGCDAPLRVALLPGALFHPPDATSAIDKVVAAAKAEGLAKDDALDALLRMEARLHAHSRVKPSYAYRADALHR